MPKLEPRNPDFARDLLSVAGNMPIVKFLGVRALALDPGEVRLDIPYRDELAFVPGTLQAGPIGTLIDIAAAWAAATLLPAGWGNATVDFSVKVFAPPIGSSFVAHATVLSAGKTLSFAEARVFSVNAGVHTLCASGLVTLRNYPVASG
jgi:uncharacterized protein (TIGR00369 family)